eukprot:m.28150 g.28150  ORF g.28150 m.28150 type:complete len:67 (+) comp30580_c0_seq1:83-283(+)
MVNAATQDKQTSLTHSKYTFADEKEIVQWQNKLCIKERKRAFGLNASVGLRRCNINANNNSESQHY